MKKYKIWDKKTLILTPIGEVFTPEQWITRYPIAGIESVTVICASGEINGGFFGTLGQMIQMCEAQGCDFSNCVTDQEKLDRIEEFEDIQALKAQEASANAGMNEELTATSLASIAASLDYQNMMTLEDEELVEEEV